MIYLRKYSVWACVCIYLLNGGIIVGQDFDHYQRLFPSGEIPQDFLLSPSEKYQKALSQLEAESREERRAKVAFYQESFYYMNQLLLSGKVLFNDSVSNYVNAVGDILLQNDPELRSQLHFYVVKSPSVNAFATNNGLILINMGLLAKLENEAQLAFVLSHEISHFIKKHPIDIFLRAKSMEHEAKGAFRRDSLEDIMLAKSNYSKEKELEADIIGLELYLRSNYDLFAAEAAFEVLKYAHLPFADHEFSPAFFETTHLHFPKTYFLDSVSVPANTTPSPGDANLKHPSPDIRKAVVSEKIANEDNTGKQVWMLGEKRFLNIQKICRYESVFLLLYYKNYESAIYHAAFLLKEQPNSAFLKKIVAQSLYALSKYNNEGRLPEVHKDYAFEEGNIQRIHYFMEMLNPLEMNLLAITYNWNLWQENPGDQELQLMTEDMMRELGKHHIDSASFLLSSLPADADSVYFIRMASLDIKNPTAFFEQTARNLRAGAEAKLRKKTLSDQEADFHPMSKNTQPGKKALSTSYEKVVFVDPFYQRIDERKERNIRFVQSEIAEQTYILLLKDYADRSDLSYEMLSTRELNQEAIMVFRDITMLNEWVNEQVLHDQLQMVSICHNQVHALSEKYGTRYFIWTGVLAFAYARTGKGLVLAAGILFPPILPYSIYIALTPDYETNIYTMVYDVESGEYQVLYPKKVKMKDKPDLLHSATYNLIHQLKNP